MTSYARIFFAGVGTTFAILAIGFGGGVLLATSAVKDNGSVVGAKSQTAVPAARIVHPTSEPVAQATADVLKPPPPVQPAVRGVTTSESSQAQPDEYQKTRKDLRAERRRERADPRAQRRARRYHWEALRRQEPSMMAFGNDAR
jgi:hypothetical protein